MEIVKRIKAHFQEVLRIKQNPHSIALGFAIGTFFSLLPTFGLGIALGLLTILVNRRISKLAMLGAFVVWNPIVQAPLYAFSYWLGDTVFSGLPNLVVHLEFMYGAYDFTRRFLLGMILMALVLSFVSYPVVYWLVERHQRKKQESTDES